jgi:hypothetical protein
LSEIEDNLSGGGVENEVYHEVRHDWSGVGGDIVFHTELEWSQCLWNWNRWSNNFQLLVTRVSIRENVHFILMQIFTYKMNYTFMRVMFQ